MVTPMICVDHVSSYLWYECHARRRVMDGYGRTSVDRTAAQAL
ncbi:hypothetical protein JMJ77_0006693, partial [Colletotrichum scovillei]